MKTLIEKTIKVRGIGNPSKKTIFTIDGEYQRNTLEYYNIEKISGRKLSVEYSFTNDSTKESSFIQLVIPTNLTEVEVKDFIIEQINAQLQ
jgi:hypothetical protein